MMCTLSLILNIRDHYEFIDQDISISICMFYFKKKMYIVLGKHGLYIYN